MTELRYFLAIVAACSAMTTVVAGDVQPASKAVVDPNIRFPNPRWASEPGGTFISPQNIRAVQKGMTKAQLYALLNPPHFSTGLIAARKWNYIFNIYTGAGAEYRACQYQVRFDGKMLVAGMWWRDQACADLVNGAGETATSTKNPEPAQGGSR